jgi:hypothetical protein
MILKSAVRRAAGWVRISMTDTENLALEQIPNFLAASREVGFSGQNREEVYDWIQKVLVERQYFSLRKAERGVVRELLRKVSGPATRQILEREWQVFGQAAYARLAEISVGHLYNLRIGIGNESCFQDHSWIGICARASPRFH